MKTPRQALASLLAALLASSPLTTYSSAWAGPQDPLPTWSERKDSWSSWNPVTFSDGSKDEKGQPRSITVYCYYTECVQGKSSTLVNLYYRKQVKVEDIQVDWPTTSSFLGFSWQSSEKVPGKKTIFDTELSRYKLDLTPQKGPKDIFATYRVVQDGKYFSAYVDFKNVGMSAPGYIVVNPPNKMANDVIPTSKPANGRKPGNGTKPGSGGNTGNETIQVGDGGSGEPDVIYVRKPLAELTAEERAWLTLSEASEYDKKIAEAKLVKPIDPKMPASVAVHDAMKPVLTDFRKKAAANMRDADKPKYEEMAGRVETPAKAEDYKGLVGGFVLWGAKDPNEIGLSAEEMAVVNGKPDLKAAYQSEMLGVDPKDLVLRHRATVAIRAKLPKKESVPDNSGAGGTVSGKGPLTKEEIAQLPQDARVAYQASADEINRSKDLTPEQKKAKLEELADKYRKDYLSGGAYVAPKSAEEFDKLSNPHKSKFCAENGVSTGGAGIIHKRKALDQAKGATGTAGADGNFDGNTRTDGGAVDPNAGGSGGQSWIAAKCAEFLGSKPQVQPGNLTVGAPPPLGKDVEKKDKKKGEYNLNQDIKAGLVGGLVGMVLACTLVPFTAPLLLPALIGFGVGGLLFGGTSRYQQYKAKNKKDE